MLALLQRDQRLLRFLFAVARLSVVLDFFELLQVAVHQLHCTRHWCLEVHAVLGTGVLHLLLGEAVELVPPPQDLVGGCPTVLVSEQFLEASVDLPEGEAAMLQCGLQHGAEEESVDGLGVCVGELAPIH